MTIPLPTPEDLARDLADDYLRVMWMPADGCPGQLALAAIRRAHAAEVALADRDDRAEALVRQRDAAEAERNELRATLDRLLSNAADAIRAAFKEDDRA